MALVRAKSWLHNPFALKLDKYFWVKLGKLSIFFRVYIDIGKKSSIFIYLYNIKNFLAGMASNQLKLLVIILIFY